MKVNVALITGIIQEQVKQDPWGTLQTVSRIGYRGMELGAEMEEIVVALQEEMP